ncbi:MAG TPA: secretion protein HlyD, partial [Campylobacterales bacterium]|nr:secretion protein HlyD [Campylobacterales bacterium]
LDSNPNIAIKAKVVQIAQKAEFTPKDVSVRSDRIQRVYAVLLKPIKYDPILKLGIPAIGVIGVYGTKLPNSLDEIPEI